MISRYFTFLKSKLTFLHQQKNLKLKKLLACNVIKKKTPAQVFSNELRESFNNAFFVEQLRLMPSGYAANWLLQFRWTEAALQGYS